ncbi:MAG: outer membrane beta-barrel family protein, partial [Pedobacter sp.]
NGWTVRGAMRAEYTNVDFDLNTAQSFAANPYFSLFPSLSVSKFIKKKYNVGLSYGVRVNRPRENTLNPQVNNADTLNISYGNPNLMPSYTHQIALNMGMYGRDWSFNPRITYSRATGVIERYRFVHPNGVSESTFDNVGSNYYISYILIGNYRPTKKTSFNGNFTLIQSDYKSAMNQSLNRGGWSVRSRVGMSFQISNRTAAEGSLNYANNLVAQGRNRSSMNTTIGIRQNFLKNRLSARISANDPFRGRHSYSFNEGTNFFADSFSRNNTNNFNLNINYRFTRIKTNKVTVPPAPKVVSKAN